jgi:hypothetical protein
MPEQSEHHNGGMRREKQQGKICLALPQSVFGMRMLHVNVLVQFTYRTLTARENKMRFKIHMF